ncbi:MAG TPA: type II toxin-antitoxin system HipA family toxin [Gammaproteobacteria bacterium]
MTLAEVRLWGRTIGAVSLEAGDTFASFQYDPAFAESGIQVSPLKMPLAKAPYRFPELAPASFNGLPGMLADSLPDRFGNALIDAWLATQNRTPESFDAVERLCYVGTRGVGALEFRPTLGPAPRATKRIRIDSLVELASDILTQRNRFSASFDGNREKALKDILRVGTSAGGARAKALIAWNRETNEVRSGQTDAGEGFEYWLLKFDGVAGNRDRELEDPHGYGRIEYAYSKMARAAGIDMSPCHLMQENGRCHFMTKRFDRQDDGGKLHMQSLAALAHFDYNLAGAYSYEQALVVIRQLGLSMDDVEQQFRRMAFNIIARNQDDHVKNIAFLMDKSGRWTLSPAFDVTYSYNPSGAWTSKHQMTMNGRQDGFTREDFRECARTASMKRGRADAIVDEVRNAVGKWRVHADETGVPDAWAEQIRENLRLSF